MLIFLIIFSFLHSSLMNHWLPISVLAHSYKLNAKQSVLVFFLSALAHNTSTIIFASIVTWVGILTSETVENFGLYASSILFAFGIYYLITFRKTHEVHNTEKGLEKKFWIVFGAILLNMLFSPCVEVLIAFFAVSASLTVSQIVLYCLIYVGISFVMMFSFMVLAHFGFTRVSFTFLEKNTRILLGIVFILMGYTSIHGDGYLESVLEFFQINNPFEN